MSRTYKIEHPISALQVEWQLPDKACPFCTHLKDMIWDYTHGPFLLLCELQDLTTDRSYDGNINGDCPYYNEAGTIYADSDSVKEDPDES